MGQCLVLTATVFPNTRLNVSLTDPKARLEQYRKVIADWIQIADSLQTGLAIVETSGVSRETLLAGVHGADRRSVLYSNVEMPSNAIPRGKGFMEWTALSSLLHSSLLGPESVDPTVYKITGRLRVTNPGRVFGELDAGAVKARMRLDGNLADTRVLGARRSMWRRHLLGAAGDVDVSRGVDIEQAVGGKLAWGRAVKEISVVRFGQRPFFDGVSGYDGTVYRPWRTQLRGLVLRPVEPVAAAAARIIAR